MDTTIKAAPMESQAAVATAIIKVVIRYIIAKAVSLTQGVVLVAVPSQGSHSISAVAPDNYLGKELAKAGA